MRRFLARHHLGAWLGRELADSHTGSLRGDPPEQVFVPYTQFLTTAGMHGYVRSQMPVESVADAIRRAVAAVDPSQPIHTMRRMSDQRDHSLSTERVSAGLASTFGVLATLLAVVGLFGALSYSVTRRTRELGLRLALGASRPRIAGLVIGELAPSAFWASYPPYQSLTSAVD